MTFYKHLYRALASGLGHVTVLKYCLIIIIITTNSSNFRLFHQLGEYLRGLLGFTVISLLLHMAGY